MSARLGKAASESIVVALLYFYIILSIYHAGNKFIATRQSRDSDIVWILYSRKKKKKEPSTTKAWWRSDGDHLNKNSDCETASVILWAGWKGSFVSKSLGFNTNLDWIQKDYGAKPSPALPNKQSLSSLTELDCPFFLFAGASEKTWSRQRRAGQQSTSTP